MNRTRTKIARIFLLLMGIILILAGLIVVIAEKENIKDTLINNFAFFLSGILLVYLGLTWKKKKPNKSE